jgi:ankyrin repeat protein/mono/diheme cytochrome c family protein
VRLRGLFCAAVVAIIAITAISRPSALGRPGITPIPCPDQTWEFDDPKFDALPGAKAFFGKYDGGLYRVEIPGNWNGELALYAHGFVSNAGANGSKIRVGNSPIREHLIKNGFAWAASSYRCNGYVPGQGLLDTMALTELFTKFNDGRAPQRVLLTGTSMGGHVTVLGMHEFPTSFAGGLAMCPAGPELFDFFAAVGGAAEVITGVQFKLDTMQQDLAKMNEILGKPPEYTDKGRQLASVEIQISGGPRPFAVDGLASRFAGNISGAALAGSTTPSNRAVMTSHIKYAIDEGLGLTADALNAGARRKALDAEIRNPMGPYDEIVPFDGKLERPLLTMHGTGDLFVPIVLQQTLKRAVVASGKQDLLVQRVYRIAGHCAFSQPEMTKAFDDLVAWVRKSTKPEGDEVYGDLSRAGMKFTEPLRPNDPGTLRIAVSAPSSPTGQAVAKVDFGREVQPILRQQCYSCHGPTQQMNGFRLDRRRDAMRGGTTSPGIIRPGNSEASLLFFRIAGSLAGAQMPPTGALRPEQIGIIKAWLDQGAEWPDQYANETAPVPLEPRAAKLMEAAQWGSTADVKALLDQSADPNTRNDVGATPLMRAINSLEKTRLLIDRGANVNARSDDGRTPLLIAAGLSGAAPVVKLLIERGANVTVKAPGLIGETTPLAEAAYTGDESVFRLLVEHGADLNAPSLGILGLALRSECRPCVDLLLKSMNRASMTPEMLLAAPPIGSALATSLLLEKGADINAKDPQGRTLLILAAASDEMPVEVVKNLIARGVDVNAKTPEGETALSVAKLRGQTPIVELLLKAGATDVSGPAGPSSKPLPAASIRAAIDRTVPLLQKTDGVFLKKSGCVSCHNNTLTAMTVAAARGKGIPVDDEAARQNLKTVANFIDGWRDRAFQGVGIPGDADTVSYILLGLDAQKHPADAATDAMAYFLRRTQLPSGQWRIFAHRPPLESSDIQVTAASMRALQLYAPKSARAEYHKAVRLAAAWLASATPRTTEERAFRLLGLGWTGASKDAIQKAGRALIAEQRADGGWSQLSTMTSDAYATGQALVALAESGALATRDAAYKRGVQFLLNTQFEDGSWFVKTRAIALQPLFEIGFPHGRDQWISAAGTNWAAMALARAYVKPS